MADSLNRCPWAEASPDYAKYHDEEWGVPLKEEQGLFEFLALEGMQAGLSWLTILRKRSALRRAFSGFDPERVARFSPRRVEGMLADPAIVRHRGKIEATVHNARTILELREGQEPFSDLVWSFVDGRPVQNRRRRLADVPASTPVSERMSKELKRRGFRFVGPTTCYAFMQATGMVNDHLLKCHRHEVIRRLSGAEPGSA
jgi:DNA-3-methyladenine glycosylase I